MMNYLATSTSARAAAAALYADDLETAKVEEELAIEAEWERLDVEERFYEHQLADVLIALLANPDDDELQDLYSDLHKDVYGFRPH